MKSIFSDIDGLSQMSFYSNATNRAMTNRSLLQEVLGEGKSKKKDYVSISVVARNFSKESIAALIDNGANVSKSELSYYFEHYNDSYAILNAINFGENVESGYNPAFKEYGVISFDYNGSRQVVPNYAVPKINPHSLLEMCAVNNSLVLNNQSYYSWRTPDGSRYTWAVNNGYVGRANSESLLTAGTNTAASKYQWEMRKAGNILSNLARGVDLYLYKREEVLSVCKSVGISTGFFSIDAGAGKHNYYLRESGKVINIDAEIERMNDINWIEAGYKEGDTFSVYGNEYTIDNTGHIYVSSNDIFTTSEIKYPSRQIY